MLTTVFISYRRSTSKYPALLVYKALSPRYDVFIDYESIDSGKFAQEILHQIAARGHFIVILSPGCLDRAVNADDWLRREIEYAIEQQRNIVPLLFDGFSFNTEKKFFTGKLAALPDYNALTVPDGYFDEAMTKLQNRFLKQRVRGVIRSATQADQSFAEQMKQNAQELLGAQIDQDIVAKYLLGVSLVETQLNTAKFPSTKSGPPKAATKSLLGREPLQDEYVIVSDFVKGYSPNWLVGAETIGRLSLTNKRLVFKSKVNTKSFEISREQISAGTITSRQVGKSHEITIHTSHALSPSIQIENDNMFYTLKAELNIKEE